MSGISLPFLRGSVSGTGPSPLSGWIPVYSDWPESGMVPFSSTKFPEEECSGYEDEVHRAGAPSEGHPLQKEESSGGIWWITAFDAAGLMVIAAALVLWVLRAGSAPSGETPSGNSASRPVSMAGAAALE